MNIGVSQAKQRTEPSACAAAEIRNFYERMPYPAPIANLDEHRELSSNPERRRALFHRVWPAGAAGANRDVLIAGCGTSQAARYALGEPTARVTAIDISETSLHHTRDLKSKYQLHNLELHRMPIESVGELGRSFDLIVCTGVLHHLTDPDLGLRALRDVLNREGAIQLMVYATYGRAGINLMQQYCRLLGVGVSDGDLCDLSGTLQALSADHPISALLGRAKDFTRPAAMADALLNPQERAYTVPEVYAWLERCGLSFGRWLEQAPYLPHCGSLSRGPHATRLTALREAAQHAAAELLRGTMTRHRLIAYGSDRVADEQRICFTGEQWRDYVPIRLSWTRCIRDRLPAGSVAVLLNPAHEYTDLILPISQAQEHLWGQIDGQRNLAEILRRCATHQESMLALQFFQQLWRYDQIVFDASKTRKL
jgi:SAM-dependent methyltransferase